MELLLIIKDKLMKELEETDFTQLYEDIDILTCIKEYNELQLLIEDAKIDKSKINKELKKIEKECLSKYNLIKIKGEEKNYYCLKNKAYDCNGSLIEYDYADYIENEELFCEFRGDNIYEYMKKNAKKHSRKENFELYEDYK